MSEKYGIVIVFQDDVSKEQIKEAILWLKSQEIVESTSGIQSFNPDHGGPVWYVP